MSLYDKLENVRSAMMDSSGSEEKVEVNQRHLIDKILARYSAEFVLYRELMQNADDANSSNVEIHFSSSAKSEETTAPQLSANCEKITFKNNGMPFREEDWTRLKRIAEGNPDEQKIGAFGVGFYSLFSVCENPFVLSGTQCMAFYFKGDQLFAKRGNVPETQRDAWTSFLMDLREPMEAPNLDNFAKFLTTSMGFTTNLREITVYFDDHLIFSITKNVSQPEAMTINRKTVNITSPQKLFSLARADVRKIQLDTKKYTPPSLLAPLVNLISMQAFSRPKETEKGELPTEKARIFLRVVSGYLDVNVPTSFSREMERSTKKKPPKTTIFQLVYTGREELDASEHSSKIFSDLVPFPHQGRVFIGFPTHQTTGCWSHMAARFIPTVERESIDFADRYLSVWNKELLTVGGLLSRMVYNSEMNRIASLFQELVGTHELSEETKDARNMLEAQASHVLQSFTFHYSSPSPLVSQGHEEHFFSSSYAPLQIMTTHGVVKVSQSRLLPDQLSMADLLSSIVKNTPIVTHGITKDCTKLIEKLKTRGMLQHLSFDDVLVELESRTLNSEDMVTCIRWWIEFNQSTPQKLNRAQRVRFLDAAVLDTGNGSLLTLSSARWWINPRTTSLDLPFPNTALPFTISKMFTAHELATYLDHVKELSLLEWSRYVVTLPELESLPSFAEKVLGVISKGLHHMPSNDMESICAIFKSKLCMPTKSGLKVPSEAYFPTVTLFDDLPTVTLEKPRSISDQLMAALGVRKHVDLQLVFTRLISDGSWSHVELVKYLASVQSTLSSEEMSRLRHTAIFTKEGDKPKIIQPESTGDQGKQIYKRYKVTELYAPLDPLRQLGLPLLQWNLRWRSTSDEAKFLEKLGLASLPSLDVLLQLASPEANNRSVQSKALSYFIEHRSEYGNTYKAKSVQTKFLPCADGKTYVAPSDCFTDTQSTVLGFNVLHKDLVSVRDKLGVEEHPSAERLLAVFLAHIDTDAKAAKARFEFMSKYYWLLDYEQRQVLRQRKFIPVRDMHSAKDSDKFELVEPTQCYFETGNNGFHKDMFIFVDFGETANSFLRSCGVKDEPTTPELASMIVKDPQRFWDLSGGGERYLGALRQIAGQTDLIKSNTSLYQSMRASPFLVGVHRTTVMDNAEASVLDTTSSTDEFVHYKLAKADQIFISDDVMGQQIFSPLSAPMEPLLEEFYEQLGSSRLSRQIKEKNVFSEVTGISPRTKAVAQVVLERTPIIIYQLLTDNPRRKKELLHDEKYIKRNLKVLEAGKIKIIRTFIPTGQENEQMTTACVDTKSCTLRVAGSGEVDYYDIANAFCQLLFSRTRFSDSILIERYLTASLLSLRRKGVPVDRILNIQKHVNTPLSPTSSPQTSSSENRSPPPSTLPPKDVDEDISKLRSMFSDCDETYLRHLLSNGNKIEEVIDLLLSGDYPRTLTAKQNSKTTDKRKSTGELDTNDPRPKLLDKIWPWKKPTDKPTQPVTAKSPAPLVKSPPQLPNSEQTITPNYASSIRQNLQRGISACKSYSNNEVFAKPRINQVAESSTYCDTAPGHDLVHVGRHSDTEFYIHRSVPAEAVLEQHGTAIKRFSKIITNLCSVFDLKSTSLHMFYDTKGPTIAFNLNGSLFLNLRFYLALHDINAEQQYENEKATKLREAHIYWFTTMCHELAHNFVAGHNAVHEFYMSSYIETYFESLIPLLINEQSA